MLKHGAVSTIPLSNPLEILGCAQVLKNLGTFIICKAWYLQVFIEEFKNRPNPQSLFFRNIKILEFGLELQVLRVAVALPGHLRHVLP